jgi:hypothetical protein
MEVGAADAAARDVHNCSSRTRLWFGYVDKFEQALSGDEAGKHQCAFSARVTAGCLAHAMPRRNSS